MDTSKTVVQGKIEEHHYLKRKLLQVFWNERDFIEAVVGAGWGGGKKDTISD